MNPLRQLSARIARQCAVAAACAFNAVCAMQRCCPPPRIIEIKCALRRIGNGILAGLSVGVFAVAVQTITFTPEAFAQVDGVAKCRNANWNVSTSSNGDTTWCHINTINKARDVSASLNCIIHTTNTGNFMCADIFGSDLAFPQKPSNSPTYVYNCDPSGNKGLIPATINTIGATSCTCAITQQSVQNGVCRCPAGQGVLANGTCGVCTGGQVVLANGTCGACPTGQVVQSGVCSACSSGQGVLANGTCGACPTGQVVQSGVCSACSSGQGVLANGNTCGVCPGGQGVLANGTCGACPSGQGILFATKTCGICPAAGQGVLTDGTCGACPTGQGVQSGVCSACPSGQGVLADGTCGACPSGQSLNSGVCACPSGQGMSPSGACAACSSGESVRNGVCVATADAGTKCSAAGWDDYVAICDISIYNGSNPAERGGTCQYSGSPSCEAAFGPNFAFPGKDNSRPYYVYNCDPDGSSGLIPATINTIGARECACPDGQARIGAYDSGEAFDINGGVNDQPIFVGGFCPSVKVCGGFTPPQFYSATLSACVQFVECAAPATLNRETNQCDCPAESVSRGVVCIPEEGDFGLSDELLCGAFGGTVQTATGGREVCSGMDANDTFCIMDSAAGFPCRGLFKHLRSCNVEFNRKALNPFFCGEKCGVQKAVGSECR